MPTRASVRPRTALAQQRARSPRGAPPASRSAQRAARIAAACRPSVLAQRPSKRIAHRGSFELTSELKLGQCSAEERRNLADLLMRPRERDCQVVGGHRRTCRVATDSGSLSDLAPHPDRMAIRTCPAQVSRHRARQRHRSRVIPGRARLLGDRKEACLVPPSSHAPRPPDVVVRSATGPARPNQLRPAARPRMARQVPAPPPGRRDAASQRAAGPAPRHRCRRKSLARSWA